LSQSTKRYDRSSDTRNWVPAAVAWYWEAHSAADNWTKGLSTKRMDICSSSLGCCTTGLSWLPSTIEGWSVAHIDRAWCASHELGNAVAPLWKLV
jgi:hypothetical protein